jgi:4-amino-4-deoxy-L-arabinose transferase-like glycosyltransferase
VSLFRTKQSTQLILLFAVSLLVRLAFLLLMTRDQAVELWDARGYFDRAIGFGRVWASLLHGDTLSIRDLAQAYNPLWPPLQSIVLSFSLTLFGHTLLVGRLTMILLSALTAPLAYLVTKKLSTEQAALGAGMLMALYPSFVHYSLRLFSETTTIFLFFLLLYLVLQTATAEATKQVALLAAVIGCLLGLAALTRAIALVWIPVVIFWLSWRVHPFRQRLLASSLVFLFAALTLLPWEVALFAHEGRVIIISTSNLPVYAADAASQPDEYKTADEGDELYLKESAVEFRQQHKPKTDKGYPAFLPLALRNLFGSIQRGFYTLRTIWLPDFQLYRYLVVLGYAPMSNTVLALIFGVTLLSFCLFLSLALWGLLNPAPSMRYRGLLLAFVLIMMAAHIAIAYAHPRYNLQLLAILLPAAAHGLTTFRSFFARANRPWAVIALLCIAGMGVSIYTGLPAQYNKMTPSSHYARLLSRLDPWLGQETTVSDQLLFRTSALDQPGEVTFSVVGGTDFVFVGSNTPTYSWRPTAEASELHLLLKSPAAGRPLQLQLQAGQGSSDVLTLKRDVWHRWQPSGLPGIDYMWVGSGGFPASRLHKP